jgi:hypothetical protein
MGWASAWVSTNTKSPSNSRHERFAAGDGPGARQLRAHAEQLLPAAAAVIDLAAAREGEQVADLGYVIAVARRGS